MYLDSRISDRVGSSEPLKGAYSATHSYFGAVEGSSCESESCVAIARSMANSAFINGRRIGTVLSGARPSFAPRSGNGKSSLIRTSVAAWLPQEALIAATKDSLSCRTAPEENPMDGDFTSGCEVPISSTSALSGDCHSWLRKIAFCTHLFHRA